MFEGAAHQIREVRRPATPSPALAVCRPTARASGCGSSRPNRRSTWLGSITGAPAVSSSFAGRVPGTGQRCYPLLAGPRRFCADDATGSVRATSDPRFWCCDTNSRCFASDSPARGGPTSALLDSRAGRRSSSGPSSGASTTRSSVVVSRLQLAQYECHRVSYKVRACAIICADRSQVTDSKDGRCRVVEEHAWKACVKLYRGFDPTLRQYSADSLTIAERSHSLSFPSAFATPGFAFLRLHGTDNASCAGLSTGSLARLRPDGPGVRMQPPRFCHPTFVLGRIPLGVRRQVRRRQVRSHGPDARGHRRRGRCGLSRRRHTARDAIVTAPRSSRSKSLDAFAAAVRAELTTRPGGRVSTAVAPRRRPRSRPRDDREGLTVTKAATRFSVSPSTIRRAIKRRLARLPLREGCLHSSLTSSVSSIPTSIASLRRPMRQPARPGCVTRCDSTCAIWGFLTTRHVIALPRVPHAPRSS